MVNYGTNHLGIDKSKTAGGRARRMAAERREQLRAANLYTITVTVYGLYKDGSKWRLTAMEAKRTRERLVSDRRGGTETVVVDSTGVIGTDPEKGLVIETFDTKKAATNKYYTPDTWTKHGSGKYWGNGTSRSFKVDRDRWRDFRRHR